MTPDEYEQAACRGASLEVFFPTVRQTGRSTPTDEEVYAEAKAICAHCPVIDVCEAEHAHERHGCWFGTTPTERGYGRNVGRETTAREFVAAALTDDYVTARQLHQSAKGRYSYSSIKITLQRLTREGFVDVIDDGPPRPKQYRLAADVEVAA